MLRLKLNHISKSMQRGPKALSKSIMIHHQHTYACWCIPTVNIYVLSFPCETWTRGTLVLFAVDGSSYKIQCRNSIEDFSTTSSSVSTLTDGLFSTTTVWSSTQRTTYPTTPISWLTTSPHASVTAPLSEPSRTTAASVAEDDNGGGSSNETLTVT